MLIFQHVIDILFLLFMFFLEYIFFQNLQNYDVGWGIVHFDVFLMLWYHCIFAFSFCIKLWFCFYFLANKFDSDFRVLFYPIIFCLLGEL